MKQPARIDGMLTPTMGSKKTPAVFPPKTARQPDLLQISMNPINSIPVYTDGVFLEHETGPGHPERPARLKSCLSALKDSENLTRRLRWSGGRPATRQEILRCHKNEHFERNNHSNAIWDTTRGKHLHIILDIFNYLMSR